MKIHCTHEKNFDSEANIHQCFEMNRNDLSLFIIKSTTIEQLDFTHADDEDGSKNKNKNRYKM